MGRHSQSCQRVPGCFNIDLKRIAVAFLVSDLTVQKEKKTVCKFLGDIWNKFGPDWQGGGCALCFIALELKEQSRMDSGEESLDALEEAFERIRIATGEENLDQLVTRYIQGKSNKPAFYLCVFCFYFSLHCLHTVKFNICKIPLGKQG